MLLLERSIAPMLRPGGDNVNYVLVVFIDRCCRRELYTSTVVVLCIVFILKVPSQFYFFVRLISN